MDTRPMRFGCCGPIENMPAMRAAGYDYAELRVVDLRPDDDETVYAPIKRQIEDAGLPPEALNVFIPPHHPVVGPDRDLEGLRAYVTTAMGRMRDLGTRLVVFGSGGARSTPPGFDHHLVPGQLQDFLLLAGGIAADHDMDLVIEPLWRDVCDTINTIVEGFVAARQSGHPRVWTLADWFHVFHNDEPLETLAEVAPRLRHIHVPVPPIAGAPEQPTDPGFDEFLDALLATGYDLRMSVEDNGKRFTDFQAQAGPALDYLRARVPAS
ncbi:MAG: sugar phosphate isomerase/epimerase [Chloroflexota bacterium]|nr:sugar phosphate isomerase/epimerase [Chloroflexota bacterium]